MRLSQSLCLTARIGSAFAIFCVSYGLGGALHKVFGPGGGDEVHDAQKMNCGTQILAPLCHVSKITDSNFPK